MVSKLDQSSFAEVLLPPWFRSLPARANVCMLVQVLVHGASTVISCTKWKKTCQFNTLLPFCSRQCGTHCVSRPSSGNLAADGRTVRVDGREIGTALGPAVLLVLR